MGKKSDNIITSVYLTKQMCNEIDKKADRENISRNELIRRYIQKGLSLDGYNQDVELIADIIRQEFQAIYHVSEIQKIMEQQTDRLAKMLMKIGKLNGGQFFLLLNVLMYAWGNDSVSDFKPLLNNAVKAGVDYMQKKDFQINSFLEDTDHLYNIAYGLKED